MLCAWVLAAAAASPIEGPIVLGRLERRPLALAFLGPHRLLMVDEKYLSTWKVEPTSLALEAELPAPVPVEAVRYPSALVHAAEGETAAWVLRSGWAEAVLVATEGGALRIESTADALPWPRAANGVRFRAGTSLIEGPLEGLGAGPYVTIATDGSCASDADGRFFAGLRPDPEQRVGSVLARPWPDVVLASTTAARAPDALLLLRVGPPAHVIARLDVDGLIRAFAVHTEGHLGRVVLAVEDGSGYALMRVDLHRPKPGSR
jgi:hypothetical protein